MGLSRNKVAVSEGAAGSPPFYGERERRSEYRQVARTQVDKPIVNRVGIHLLIAVQFPGTVARYGGVAQLGEHLPCKQGVRGSIPLISTNGEAKRKNTDCAITYGPIAQLVRALG